MRGLLGLGGGFWVTWRHYCVYHILRRLMHRCLQQQLLRVTCFCAAVCHDGPTEASLLKVMWVPTLGSTRWLTLTVLLVGNRWSQQFYQPSYSPCLCLLHGGREQTVISFLHFIAPVFYSPCLLFSSLDITRCDARPRGCLQPGVDAIFYLCSH